MWKTYERLELATLIQETWWQGQRPPEKAPEEWSLGRDLDICRQMIEREGETAEDLLEILRLYDGPPATLAVFWKKDERGLRKIFSELKGRWLKNQGAERPKVPAHPDVDPNEGPTGLGDIIAGIMGDHA